MTHHIDITNGCQDALSEALGNFLFKARVIPETHPVAPWRLDVPAEGRWLYLVLSGDGWIFLPDAKQSARFSAGDALLVARPCEHRLCDPKQGQRMATAAQRPTVVPSPGQRTASSSRKACEPTRLLRAQLEFTRQPETILQAALPPLIHVPGRHGQQASCGDRVARLINEELDSELPGAKEVITSLLRAMFAQAVRQYAMHLPAGEADGLGALLGSDIAPTLALMHRCPEEPWTIERLAEEAAMSRSVFCARFTVLMGISPGLYLTDCRMQKAGSLLRTSRLGLKEIAVQIGYRSVAAFSKAFKRWGGVAPGAYRNEDNGI